MGCFLSSDYILDKLRLEAVSHLPCIRCIVFCVRRPAFRFGHINLLLHARFVYNVPIYDKLASLRVEDCQASRAEDKELILQKIEDKAV